MDKTRKIINYINSRDFLVDTMLHREGDKFVYLEAIPSDGRKKMEWINTHLFNCKCIVKHVGTHSQIADLIAKKLGFEKVDKELFKRVGVDILSDEYLALDYVLNDLPKVVNSIEEAKHVQR